MIAEAYAYGFELEMPEFISNEMLSKGSKVYMEKYRGVPVDFAGVSRNTYGLRTIQILESSYHAFQRYENYKREKEVLQKWGLSRSNYQETLEWTTKEFMRFSHDLSVSKIITQPIFYGDLEIAKEAIRNMDNFELLSTFDDYSVSDEEIESYVKEANYFKYEERKDLSILANIYMSWWYKRNREIYEKWTINTPKRVLLSMEITKELDRRTLIRQDAVIGKMLAQQN